MKFAFLLSVIFFAKADTNLVLSQARYDFQECLIENIRDNKNPVDESLDTCRKKLNKNKEFRFIKPEYEVQLHYGKILHLYVKVRDEKSKQETNEILSVFNISPDDRFCNNCNSASPKSAIAELKNISQDLKGNIDTSCLNQPPGGYISESGVTDSNKRNCEVRCFEGFYKVGENCISKCKPNEIYRYNQCLTCEEYSNKMSKMHPNQLREIKYKRIFNVNQEGYCIDQFGCELSDLRYSFMNQKCLHQCQIGYEIDEVLEQKGELYPCKKSKDYCEQRYSYCKMLPYNDPPKEVLDYVPGCDVQKALSLLRHIFENELEQEYQLCNNRLITGGKKFYVPFPNNIYKLISFCAQLHPEHHYKEPNPRPVNQGTDPSPTPSVHDWRYPDIYYLPHINY